MDAPKLGEKMKFAQPFEIEVFFLYPLPDIIFMEGTLRTRIDLSLSQPPLLSISSFFLSSFSLSLSFF